MVCIIVIENQILDYFKFWGQGKFPVTLMNILLKYKFTVSSPPLPYQVSGQWWFFLVK